MKKPLISLCIPTYNRAQIINNTIGSIIDNNITRDYEIVVADNASADETKNVINILKKTINIHYIINNNNIGPCNNILKAVEAASGEYVWLLGDDDPLNPVIIKHIFEIINKHPEVDYIFVPRRLVDKDLKPTLIGIQPSGIQNDKYYRTGRELYCACNEQIPKLIGFYGSNIIRKEAWDISLNELSLECDSWFHMKVILNAIKERPCAISSVYGVNARIFTSPEAIDSKIWIDSAVAVIIQANKWGYSKTICDHVINDIISENALLFVLEKAEGKRSGSIISIAKKFNLKRILKWNSVWMFISFLPKYSLFPLLWIRKVRKMRNDYKCIRLGRIKSLAEKMMKRIL